MRRRFGGLIYAVLTAGALISVASGIALLLHAREETRLALSAGRDDLVWYANQFELELGGVVDTIERYRYGRDRASARDVVDRFDVFWSRVGHATSGTLGQAFGGFEGAPQAIADARTTLDAIDPALAGLDTLDEASLQSVVDRLRALRPAFRALSMQALAERQSAHTEYVDRQGAYLARIGYLMLGLLVFGAGTALLLALDRARLATLRDDLERRFRARTRELRESEQRYRALVENAPEAIVVLDVEDGRFVDVNENACAMFGLDRDALLERGMIDLSPPIQPDGRPSPEAARERIARAVGGETSAFDWIHCDASGRDVVCEVRLARLPGKGAAQVRGTMVDVTERRRIEGELARYRGQLETLVAERTAELVSAQHELVRRERLAAIGELIGTVSHELRNPLGTITASFAILRGRLAPADGQTERVMERIERNIDRCVLIISELLDYARIRELSKAEVDVDEWLHAVLAEVEVDPVVSLTHRLESHARACIDSDRMRQALVNLVQNAGHALVERDDAQGRREIHVAARTLDGHLEIDVSDTGPGIPEELRDQVFEPLFSTRAFGVGLGLPLVRRIAEQHAGDLTLRSAPGAGATFTIRVPLDAAER